MHPLTLTLDGGRLSVPHFILIYLVVSEMKHMDGRMDGWMDGHDLTIVRSFYALHSKNT
jgi:hypothetical protein